MIRRAILLTVAGFLMAGSGAVLACDYKQGETKFVDYANCRYGEEAVVVVDLPDDHGWQQCVYLAEAFRPAKLLAVTREKNGKEQASINDRAQIGNPCYLTKQACDKAFKAAQK